ncbi:MAG: hypothetical protein J7621_25825 [Niastella sp.]|nr:hypothetical protein [Niastella sp.]
MDIKQIINKNIGNEPAKEWICRLLLTINVILTMSGLIDFIQTEYQLVSPIIPPSAILEIARPHIYASMVAGIVLLISLWFYFFKKHLLVIILQVLLIITYQTGLIHYFT